MRKSLLPKALAFVMLGTAVQANIAEISRCNAKVASGVYKPALRVDHGTGTTLIFIGEQGLTRSMYYKDARVISFATSQLGLTLPQNMKEVPSCGTGVNGNGTPTEMPTETPTITPERDEPTLVSDLVG